jgi:hypothetical protein
VKISEKHAFFYCIILINELYFCLRDKIAQAKKLEIAVWAGVLRRTYG